MKQQDEFEPDSPVQVSEPQQQTSETFTFKWSKRNTYESDVVESEAKKWLIEKYFDGREDAIDLLLGENKAGRRLRILDAGCGSGFSALALFGDRLVNHDYTGIDVSNSTQVANLRFAERGIPATFDQADLMDLPIGLSDFDLIFSEGVLHHTDSVSQGISSLAARLAPGGILMFYVYRTKAPVREFTDDLVRSAISGLSNEQAWEALKPLTKLGKALGDLDIVIDIEESIPFLEIDAGPMNLQRLFFYKFLKAFYHPHFSFEQMNHINFDWFRPANCWRHTPQEIEVFVQQAGLSIQRLHADDSGVSVIARKTSSP